jgi:hypothetical protein
MRIRILSAGLLLVARFLQTHAACIGSTNTIALYPDNQSIGYSSLGSNESSYINCGAHSEVYSGVDINNASSHFTSNKYGKEQNSPEHSYNQHITNNYRLVSRPVKPGNGITKNIIGGISSSYVLTFNNSNFINNNGLEAFFADEPALNVNLSGAGNVSPGGNLTTNSGLVIHAKRSLQILDPLSHFGNKLISVGSSLLSHFVVPLGLHGKAELCIIKDQIPDFSFGGLFFPSNIIESDFGINFHLMENSKNLFLSNQLIYNI